MTFLTVWWEYSIYRKREIRFRIKLERMFINVAVAGRCAANRDFALFKIFRVDVVFFYHVLDLPSFIAAFFSGPGNIAFTFCQYVL